MNEHITIEEFVNIAGVKESTIKKRKNSIPGLKYENDKFIILSGTRYPCDLHRDKLKNSDDRRYALLKMISEYKYISHNELRIYPEQFVELLRELLAAGLIKENHLSNHFGANAYDCTEKGDRLLNNKKNEIVKQMINMVASTTGKFVGSIISEVAA